MKTKVAVVGLGFVGGTIYKSFMQDQPVYCETVGIDPAKGFNATIKDIADFDAVFVCVPSPQSADGTADTSILEAVLKDLDAVDFKGVIISKVTAPPDVYTRLQDTYYNLVHAPEFLTAANAFDDYIHGRFAIIGGKVSAFRNEAERIIRMSQSGLNSVVHCTIGEAALAKYTINSFLATKVVFMNEMEKLATNSRMDWQKVVSAIRQDNRIGVTHMQVPGPDGQYGFGGMCFPKDTSALLKYAESQGSNLSVLDSAVKKNLIIRLKND
jgi:nucleotide sugar dehydrogenase